MPLGHGIAGQCLFSFSWLAGAQKTKPNRKSIPRGFMAAGYHFAVAVRREKVGRMRRVKYWEVVADNLHDAGWSLGWVSALDLNGRTVWIVDAHGYGKHFIVRADEMLTALVGIGRDDSWGPRLWPDLRLKSLSNLIDNY
jgi:hypothetical protein